MPTLPTLCIAGKPEWTRTAESNQRARFLQTRSVRNYIRNYYTEIPDFSTIDAAVTFQLNYKLSGITIGSLNYNSPWNLLGFLWKQRRNLRITNRQKND